MACPKVHWLGTAPCHHPQDRCSPGRALLLRLKLSWPGRSQPSMTHFHHWPISGQVVEGVGRAGSGSSRFRVPWWPESMEPHLWPANDLWPGLLAAKLCPMGRSRATLPAHLLPSWHGRVSHLSPGLALRTEAQCCGVRTYSATVSGHRQPWLTHGTWDADPSGAQLLRLLPGLAHRGLGWQ